MIETVNLNKSYGDLHVLKDINITINKGEKVVVIGPSGSGKSTFLRCLNCMEDPTSGQIIFNGVDIADMSVDINVHRQKMGMVFQHFNLFNNKTVIENIMLAPVYVETKKMKALKRKKFFRKPITEPIKTKQEIKDEAHAQAIELLKRIGLESKADVYPSQLSGGQKQRVAIARAMVNKPDILLADEPTGALDSKSSRQIMELFQTLNDEGVTVIMITHDRSIAGYAKRVVDILDGELSEHKEVTA